MKGIITNINKVFESRIRLGVMSILMVNEWVDFNTLKEMLEATDGNLASHLTALEKNKCVAFKKEFIGRKPKTSYKVTPLGRKAFMAHLDALERLLRPGS